MRISASKTITYKYFYKLEVNKGFIWNLGLNPQYWYQVIGCCKNSFTDPEIDSDGNDIGITLEDVCPPINTNLGCVSKNSRYFQTILASNPEDVCQTLKENNWDWKICEFKRWSKPAENLYVDPLDDCNQLQDVDWKQVLECFQFNIEKSFLEILNFNMGFSYTKSSGDTSPQTFNLKNIKKITRGIPGDVLFRKDIDFSFFENILFEMTASVKYFKFSDSESIQYTPSNESITVSCKNCLSLPSTLYVDNNLSNLNYFSNFIYLNNYNLSDEPPLLYNKTTDIWSNIFNFNDNFKNEYWKVFFSFGCTGELNSDFYYWKFSLNFLKKDNSGSSETRFLVSIPSNFICKYSQDNILYFEYNLLTKYLFINYESYYDNFYFIDEIGIFDNIYWENNPKLRINISTGKIKKRLSKKTIIL